ncbi:MAG: hypothetical protein AAFY34_12030 [Pseudomonadota bacterium]
MDYIKRVAAGGNSGFTTGSGHVDFALGFGSTFVENTVGGVFSTLDFAQDTIGTGFFHLRNGVNALTGRRGNEFRTSRNEFVQSRSAIASAVSDLIDLADDGPLVLAARLLGARNRAAIASNAQVTAFQRGRTNPDFQIGLNLLTAGIGVTKAGAVSSSLRGFAVDPRVVRLENGAIFENAAVSVAARSAFSGTSVRRLSVRAFKDDGSLSPRFVLDQAGFRANQEFRALEFQLSDASPLTVNQKIGFPLLKQNGGVISGNKGRRIGLPAGTIIAPTTVERFNGPQIPNPDDF